ncbi:hypothetical protein [Plantactinospora veratri]
MWSKARADGVWLPVALAATDGSFAAGTGTGTGTMVSGSTLALTMAMAGCAP